MRSGPSGELLIPAVWIAEVGIADAVCVTEANRAPSVRSRVLTIENGAPAGARGVSIAGSGSQFRREMWWSRPWKFTFAVACFITLNLRGS